MTKEQAIKTAIDDCYIPMVCTSCLLCGEIIELGHGCHHSVPRICDDCKELWKKLKEANKDA